ncbi:MAG: N-acetylneuraminate synthase family protein [Aggregatilineales bacterium]
MITPPSVKIGSRQIGYDYPCFVIAEAGVNHNGDIQLAHKLIDVAADAKVDAIKFQTFDPKSLATPAAVRAVYQAENMGESGSQLDMLEKLALPREAYDDLKQHAEEANLVFLSTPFDSGSAALLNELGVDAFKVSSGDLTNLPFLKDLLTYHKPLLISTGMADMEEVNTTINRLRSVQGDFALALLHCVSNYPSQPADSNLSVMLPMREQFNVPVGWSDHTMGHDVTVAAVALGAELIEKHITLDRDMPGPDHRASLEPIELIKMMEAIRNIEAALGNGIKKPVPAEIPIAEIGRRSLYWNSNISVGTPVTETDFISLRPATGISPMEQDDLIGRILTQDVTQYDFVRYDDFA